MPKKRVALQLDEDLLRRIDEGRGIVPRAAWIARACERDLERLAAMQPKKEA